MEKTEKENELLSSLRKKMNLPYYEVSKIEQAVIGVCFLDAITLDELVEFGVKDWWFRSSANKKIWKTMCLLRERGDEVDIVNTSLEMEQQGTLSSLPAGPSYIAGCASEVASPSQAIHYARVFRKYVKLRMLNNFSTQLKSVSEQPNKEPEEILSFIKERLENIESMVEKPPETLRDLYNQVFAEIARFDRESPAFTGFEKIDGYIGGLYPHEMTVLAGESGIGKTAFLTSILNNVNKRGLPVALFSLEMGNTILAMRMLSSSARIPLKKIREGNVPLELMYDAVKAHASETFYVKTDCWCIEEIEATTRVLVRTKGVKLVGIDYIQLVEGLSGRNRNREQEISGIGRSFKKLAKDCGVHTIALSQLDDAWDGKPTGRNLRESKALKHHSDNVLILYKPKREMNGLVRCNIDKGRNNKTGDVSLGFIGGFTEFVNDPRDVSLHDDEYFTGVSERSYSYESV